MSLILAIFLFKTWLDIFRGIFGRNSYLFKQATQCLIFRLKPWGNVLLIRNEESVHILMTDLLSSTDSILRASNSSRLIHPTFHS